MSEPRILPEADPRVETGTVQFGEDWPGLFIRGDACFAWAGALDFVLTFIPWEETYTRGVVSCMIDDLRATRVVHRATPEALIAADEARRCERCHELECVCGAV